MANSSLSFNRFGASLILLAFTSTAFAYSPPATPNLPLKFEFSGPNASAESSSFYSTQCDSDDFSWYGTDWFCATGVPENAICFVSMAYHSSDVNGCQASQPPAEFDPQSTSDQFIEGSGSNSKAIQSLEGIRAELFFSNFNDNQYYATDIGLSKQTNALLSQINRAFSSNDNRAVVDAVNSWGSTLWNESRKQFEEDNHYKVREEMRAVEFRDAINEKWDYQGGMIQDIDAIAFYSSANNSRLNWLADFVVPNVATSINNAAANNTSQELSLLTQINQSINGLSSGGVDGDGGTATDLSPLFPYLGEIRANTGMINNSLGTLNSINGSLNGMNNVINNTSASEQLLLKSIDDSIKALNSIPSDFTSITDAIANSEKAIVDAIGGIGQGSGADSDNASSVGCASFTCSSSSAICYIARKEWEKSCSSSGQDSENQAGVDGLTAQLKDYIDSPESSLDNIDAGKLDTTTLLNHYTSSNGVSLGGSDTCPAPYVVDIAITTVTIDLTPFCDIAAVIRWFLIAFATVGAGLMIAKFS
ncbi:virulence factor TspB C-terminal domain-related protein [Shewanella glacialipiscicola]|uniref:virulence factor TspB C-terminal domain-related protein n=1 Tax=Shewanella glacialipiscicola TaxID=614069 RepID=UPI003D78D5F6